MPTTLLNPSLPRMLFLSLNLHLHPHLPLSLPFVAEPTPAFGVASRPRSARFSQGQQNGNREKSGTSRLGVLGGLGGWGGRWLLRQAVATAASWDL